jgi:hypothetical protein
MQRYNNFLNYQKYIKENLDIFLKLKIFLFFLAYIKISYILWSIWRRRPRYKKSRQSNMGLTGSNQSKLGINIRMCSANRKGGAVCLA